MKKIALLAFLYIPLVASADQITFVWDTVSDARVAGYELRWGTSPSTYSANAIADADGADTDSLQVSLTEPGTYYFAVRSRNSDGTLVSQDSNEVIVEIGASGVPVPSGFRKLIQISVN